MEKITCKEKGCGKVIEGYNKNHVEYLLKQHMLWHENKERKTKREK